MYGKLFCPEVPRVDIDTACRRHPRECRSWISTLELDGNLYFLLRVTPVGSIHFVWGQAKFSEFILKMTKFNKLNLAWPGWLHSIPYSKILWDSLYAVPRRRAPRGILLAGAAPDWFAAMSARCRGRTWPRSHQAETRTGTGMY